MAASIRTESRVFRPPLHGELLPLLLHIELHLQEDPEYSRLFTI
jgi:hypothetical protein